MKKLVFIFGLIFMLLIPFVYKQPQVVFADSNGGTSINMLSEITSATGNYVLNRDIDYAGTPFTPISEFHGTFDGNGHIIKNLTITGTEGDLAIFLNAQGATICNLQLQNIKIELTNSADSYASKVAFLVADANGTTIQNVSVVDRSEVVVNPDTEEEVVTKYPSQITVETMSSAYIGGIAAVANSGTKFVNCHCLCQVDINLTNPSKQLYFGGMCGYFENSQALNMVASVDLILTSVPSQENVGGMFGYVGGDKAEIKNCILIGSAVDNSDELLANNVQISSFIGKVDCPSNTPQNLSLNYFYTAFSGIFIGNSAQLEYYHDNNYTNFDVSALTLRVVALQDLLVKSFYKDTTKFDQNKEFNFDTNWQITEKKSLPFLQYFSVFEYELSEDDAFLTCTKPNIDSNVIEFLPGDSTFRYLGQIVVGGYITNVKNIDKFYKIVGLMKDKQPIFTNQRVLNVINSEDAEVIEEGNVTTYKLHSDTVVAQKSQINGKIGMVYKLNDSNISWGTYEDSTHVASIYYIDNCIMEMEGTYSFVLDTIKYNVQVRTENALYGTIRRDGASESVKQEYIEDEVYYGQTLVYIADSTSDFAFYGWKNDLESDDITDVARRLVIAFNETAFEEGGILNGYSLDSESFVFYATFTKQVCEIIIKFAVNDAIITDNISKIYINDKEVAPDVNGIISQKVKKGSECIISVTVPEKYEFTNWYLSDGKSNLGAISEQPTLTIQIDTTEEQKILVANLHQETNKIANMGYIWWIIGGSVGGVVLIGLFVFLIVRKRKDNFYKNMYY